MHIDRHNLRQSLLKTNLFIQNEFFEQYVNIVSSDDAVLDGIAYHKHHIIPRCYFNKINQTVDNSDNNIVNLSYSNHILAHFYLYKCCQQIIKKEMCFSFFKLFYANRKRVGQETSPEIDIILQSIDSLQIEYNNFLSQHKKGKKSSIKGKISIIDIDNNIKYIVPDELSYWESLGWKKGGKPLTEQHKEINKQYMLNRVVSEETKAKLSNSKKGLPSPTKGKKGTPWSNDTRVKMNQILTNLKTLHKDNVEIRVKSDLVESYQKDGWILGRLNTQINTINKGHKIMCVETNQMFLSIRSCCDQLMLNRDKLSKHLKGYVDNCNGMHFVYVDDEKH